MGHKKKITCFEFRIQNFEDHRKFMASVGRVLQVCTELLGIEFRKKRWFVR